MANHIEITTMIPCINNCGYCPQGLLRESYRGNPLLTLDKFKKALTNIPKDVEIHFSAFSEPFGNRESSRMMEYAHNQGYEVIVYSTLRGITIEDMEIITKIPFKEFYVHDIGIKRPILPFKYEIVKIDQPISRAGNLWDIPVSDHVRCSRNTDFKQNVMLPNGDIYLCCMDYGLKHKLGNIFDTNFNELQRDDGYELCRTCEKSV